jgi:RNA polymerase sigma-70 factor, ECF subfamily
MSCGEARVTDEIRTQMVEILPRLRRFAYALTGNRDNADDLVQEACMRALTRIESFEPGTRLDSWMFRIAQNIWLDRGRTNRRRGPTVDIDDAHDLSDSDGRTVTESRLTLALVERAMEDLPAEQRVLIALVCIDGLSYKEAADVTGAPIGTVMSRLARARQALHAAIEPPLPVPLSAQVRHGTHH